MYIPKPQKREGEKYERCKPYYFNFFNIELKLLKNLYRKKRERETKLTVGVIQLF